MLQLQHITKVFNAGKATEVAAVQDLTLHLEPQSFNVLVGANGSGKSTLLNLIAGSIYPDTGNILLREREIQRLADYRRSRWIGRVFQNPLMGTAASLSVLDNFRMAALRRSTKWMTLGTGGRFRKQVAEKIATLGMGLENKLTQPMGSLSGGQRQALTLLMTVMADVDVLLLDEPSAALDPRSARQVMEIANRLIAEDRLTALLVTHNISEALRYGSRLIQMESGKVIRDYDVAAKRMLDHSAVVSWFDYF
ncbi:ABC transporter ATP-binding protein [Parapedobacter sp. 10938]|uniref:ABC transporter ATP-binding protein n=1 Tax=Parapedobacter flavus TaxID=3110225 RepID=UPI002DB83A2B|nr:ATP-binding cassette domain-containing protein [Parapedobacter sp. 10938]MEC3881724.1 ATP-binding cassette domain-containing protein [Parapedobacter sp. 10938]